MRLLPRWQCGAALWVALVLATPPALTATRSAADGKEDAAAQLVRQALLAEASGKTSLRDELLQRRARRR